MREHQELLGVVFKHLQEASLKLNIKKCNFAHDKIIYLGFGLSADGIRTDPDKVKNLKDWPTPIDVCTVRRFLGFASYYRRYLSNFAKIAVPLHQLLREGVKFNWDDDCAQAFQTLRIRLMTVPVLICPDFTKPLLC